MKINRELAGPLVGRPACIWVHRTQSFSLATEYLKRKQDEECTSPFFINFIDALQSICQAAQWARILAEKNRTHTGHLFSLGWVCVRVDYYL